MSALPISAAASVRKQTVRSARWKLGFGIAGVADCIGFNCLKNPLLRMSGIAVGLIVGYIVALFLGKVDFSALQTCR